MVIGAPIAYWGKTFAASFIQDFPINSPVPIAFGAAVMIAVAQLAAYGPGG